MRQSQTAVLERNSRLRNTFATEPFEAAWAVEGRWFVQILQASPADLNLTARTQVSPDGLVWCDLDGVDHELAGEGMVSWPVRDFGQWLRLRGTVGPGGAEVKVRIYLSVKS